LTLALALRKVGLNCEVYERAPELREIGAGIGVWTNALKVLDRLGVGARVREIGLPLSYGAICNPRGRTLSRLHTGEVAGEEGAGNYVIHRAELHAALAAGLPSEIIKTGHEATALEPDDTGVSVRFANGHSARGDLLVGADGLKSIVRAALWGPGALRYSGQTCFRGIAALPPPDADTLREIQGAGRRFGIAPLRGNRVYWFACYNAPEGQMVPFAERQALLLQTYRGWPWQVEELIAATPAEKILQNDLHDRAPLPQWSQGRITLLGDAAHPTTPNFGQGACMAIEDALVLARELAHAADFSQAWHSYEAQRRARTARIVAQSWTFGRLAAWRHPLAVWLRETATRATPSFVMRRTFRQLVAYNAGDLPDHINA
jgi:2-polyprenyl-6-methoxyphenol hydroxylase-like FAD-dependent oxidoreductase